MAGLHPMFSYGSDVVEPCPRCETPGGYIRRIQRPWWRRWFFFLSREKRYLCQECDHKFYLHSEDEYD